MQLSLGRITLCDRPACLFPSNRSWHLKKASRCFSSVSSLTVLSVSPPLAYGVAPILAAVSTRRSGSTRRCRRLSRGGREPTHTCSWRPTAHFRAPLKKKKQTTPIAPPVRLWSPLICLDRSDGPRHHQETVLVPCRRRTATTHVPVAPPRVPRAPPRRRPDRTYPTSSAVSGFPCRCPCHYIARQQPRRLRDSGPLLVSFSSLLRISSSMCHRTPRAGPLSWLISQTWRWSRPVVRRSGQQQRRASINTPKTGPGCPKHAQQPRRRPSSAVRLCAGAVCPFLRPAMPPISLSIVSSSCFPTPS